VSQRTTLTKDGRWPFYVSLYSGKGFAGGWLQLQSSGNEASPDFGSITWVKPVQLLTKYYPAGFTNQMQAFVSTYQSGYPALGYNVGNAIFQSANPSYCITNGFSVDSSSKIRGTNKLNLTIGPSGSFRGSVMNALTGKMIPLSGVVLQEQHFGCGFFLDGDQSVNVYLGP
jgi:hypothetical protein